LDFPSAVNQDDEAAIVGKALRLKAEGKSERAIAAATGKPRHWVRFQFPLLAKSIGTASSIVAIEPQTALSLDGADGRALSLYDTACKALAAAKDLGEVKDIADKAVALKEYARRAKDRELEVNAAELRIRAERRLGEMLSVEKAAGRIAEGRPAKAKNCADEEQFPQRAKLDEIGIDRKLSARAQKLAVFDESAFGERLDEWRERAMGEAPRVSTNMLKDAEQSERRAAHAAKTFAGGTVADLHALAASGFRASAILADPPWKFVTRSERGEGRSANQHYRTDGLDLIKALPVAELAAPAAVLFMWMVDWCPAAALEVIEAWGFEHKTTAFTWAKQNESGEGWHMGQGYWTRANPEQCWLAVRRGGHPQRLYADVRQLIVAPVAEHSRKPDEIYERIERLVDGPYLELYARRERDGWMSWGDELSFKMPGAKSPHASSSSETDQGEAA
jgi:N6-adenosine-specific RNA methylase IME4